MQVEDTFTSKLVIARIMQQTKEVIDTAKLSKRGPAVSGTQISLDTLHTEYEKGSIVWVEIKGHPWWPGIVITISESRSWKFLGAIGRFY
jgi:hypothetical protein